MKTLPSVVLPVYCSNEDCGQHSVYQFWPDGSFKKIIDACWHPKNFPSREMIRVEMSRDALRLNLEK